MSTDPRINRLPPYRRHPKRCTLGTHIRTREASLPLACALLMQWVQLVGCTDLPVDADQASATDAPQGTAPSTVSQETQAGTEVQPVVQPETENASDQLDQLNHDDGDTSLEDPASQMRVGPIEPNALQWSGPKQKIGF
jgi:hypothetical protein